MPPTPATTVPALSNGQTGADLAEKAGVTQGEYMSEQGKYPGLNPDAIIGNIMTRKAQKAPVPEVKPAPATITSDLAVKKDQTNMKDLAAATGGAFEYADGTFSYSNNVGSPIYDKNGAVVGSVKETTAEGAAGSQSTEKKSEVGTLLSDSLSQSEKELNDYYRVLESRRAQLSSSSKAAIDDIKATFEARKAEMRQLNEGIVGSTTQAGIRSGRNKYAPEMEANILSETERAGLKRLTDLDRQELTAIQQAEAAAADKDFELLDKYMNATREFQKEKRQTILDLHKTVMDEQNAALDRVREKREQAKFEFEVAEAEKKPLLEAEQKAQDFMYELALKYPDAGVDSTDTIASATEKIRKSPAFQADLAKTLADAQKATTGGGASDATIRSFAQELLKSGSASNPYEADQMARAYFETGMQPEAEMRGAGEQSIVEGAKRLSSRNSEAQQTALMQNVTQKLDKGDILGATTDVYTNAYATLPAAQQEKAFGYIQGLNNLDDIETMMSEFRAEGGDISMLSGTKNAIEAALKRSNNPKLQEIGNRITLAMTDYRKTQSGSAFTESEEKLYKAAFPSTFGTESFNAAKIKSLRDAFNVGLKSQLQVVLGASEYDKMENLRVAETARPELEKQAKAQGYDAADVKRLIKDGATKAEIEAVLQKKKSDTVASEAKRIASAIKQVESGGNYNAKGGSGEFGAYQFMPNTWKGWAKTYLGDSNAPMSQANQDKVAEARINDLLKEGKTPEQIALIWNGGQPIRKKGTNKFGVKYDSGAYADKVLGVYNKA